MGHTKIKIQLVSPKDAKEFVDIINSVDTVNDYAFEDGTGTKSADARSYLGAMYASSEFGESLYLINSTVDGYFPEDINYFKK